MVITLLKKIIFIAVLLTATVSLNAKSPQGNLSLEEKIINLLEKPTYQTHRRFIQVLFKKREKFLIDGDPNAIKIIETLLDNGLFKLRYNKPVNMTLIFSIQRVDNLLLSIKSIKESLNALGYNFFVIDKAQYTGPNAFRWVITFKTDINVNPILFNKELGKRGISIKSIFRNDTTKWFYQLEVKDARIMNAKRLRLDTLTNISKKGNEVFLKIPDKATDGFSYVSIKNHSKSSWYPYVVFYDKKLNILNIFEDKEITVDLKLSIPPEAYYIKLSDVYISQNSHQKFEILITH